MRTGWIWGGLLGLALLTGCRGTSQGKPIEPAPNVGEKMIWSSHPNGRPAWTYKEPEKEDDTLFFVGVSGKYATEKEGREDAHRSAINNVVRYIGTWVRDNFQRLATSYGLSADIVDPTVAARRFEEQLSFALASRVKVKEYYMEKWQNKLKETYYVIYALAGVPQKAIDNIYQDTVDNELDVLRKKRDAANNEKAKKQYEDAMKAFEEAKKQGFGPPRSE